MRKSIDSLCVENVLLHRLLCNTVGVCIDNLCVAELGAWDRRANVGSADRSSTIYA